LGRACKAPGVTPESVLASLGKGETSTVVVVITTFHGYMHTYSAPITAQSTHSHTKHTKSSMSTCSTHNIPPTPLQSSDGAHHTQRSSHKLHQPNDQAVESKHIRSKSKVVVEEEEADDDDDEEPEADKHIVKAQTSKTGNKPDATAQQPVDPINDEKDKGKGQEFNLLAFLSNHRPVTLLTR
jgi:hypothetical protein